MLAYLCNHVVGLICILDCLLFHVESDKEWFWSFDSDHFAIYSLY